MGDFLSLTPEQYAKVRRILINYFRHKGCPVPEDLFHETITRVIERAAAGNPLSADYLIPQFLRAARYVWLEYLRKPEMNSTSFDDLLPGSEPSIDPVEEQRCQENELLWGRMEECSQKCLDELPVEQSEMFRRYHLYEKGKKAESRQQLVEEMGITPELLRLKVHRIRRKLEVCVEKCVSEIVE